MHQGGIVVLSSWAGYKNGRCWEMGGGKKEGGGCMARTNPAFQI